MEQTKIIIYGCGVMGLRVAEILSKKKSFAIVGAIDIDPELVGKDTCRAPSRERHSREFQHVVCV